MRTRRLTITYGLALALLALLALGGSAVVSGLVQQQRRAAEVVNVAGRQRMLSQRIGMLLTQAEPAALEDAVSRFAQAQFWLHAPPAGAQGEALEALLAGPQGLDAAVARFIEDVARARAGDAAARTRALEAVRGPLLEQLERQAQLHADASQRGVERALFAERALLVALLLLLAFEAAFIFRPLLGRLAGSLETTERALSDASAREAHLRGVLDASDDGFLVVDAAGQLVGVSSARLERWFPGLQARGLAALLPDAQLQPVRRALEEGSRGSLEDRYRALQAVKVTLEGEGRSWEVSARVLTQTPATSLLVVREVTLERALEQERRLTDEARQRADATTRERLESLARVAAGIAHDLATPAAFVGSNVEFALDDAQLHGEARQALEDAREGARRITRLVEALRQLTLVSSDAHERVELSTFVAQHAAGVEALTLDLTPVPPVTLPTGAAAQLLREVLALTGTGEGAAQLRIAPDERGGATLSLARPGKLRVRSGQLARCRAIVDALGGTLEVDEREASLSLTVHLPTATH